MKLVKEKLDRFGIKIFETSYNKEAAEFFDDVVGYDIDVLKKYKKYDNHNFPEIVGNYAGYGKVNSWIGNDGHWHGGLKIRGSLRKKNGTFEFIKNDKGIITHYLFKQDNIIKK